MGIWFKYKLTMWTIQIKLILRLAKKGLVTSTELKKFKGRLQDCKK